MSPLTRQHKWSRETRCGGSGEIAQAVGGRDVLSGEPDDVEYTECSGCPDCRVIVDDVMDEAA